MHLAAKLSEIQLMKWVLVRSIFRSLERANSSRPCLSYHTVLSIHTPRIPTIPWNHTCLFAHTISPIPVDLSSAREFKNPVIQEPKNPPVLLYTHQAQSHLPTWYQLDTSQTCVYMYFTYPYYTFKYSKTNLSIHTSHHTQNRHSHTSQSHTISYIHSFTHCRYLVFDFKAYAAH
jgi:hypothetical protein